GLSSPPRSEKPHPLLLAPGNALMIGWTIAVTNVLTSAANAVAMTNATARSTILPRNTKSLNPLSIRPPSGLAARDTLSPAQMLGRIAHRRDQSAPGHGR